MSKLPYWFLVVIVLTASSAALLFGCATVFPAQEQKVYVQLPPDATLLDTTHTLLPLERDSFGYASVLLRQPQHDLLLLHQHDSLYLVRPTVGLRSLCLLDQFLGAGTSALTFIDDVTGNAYSYSGIDLRTSIPLPANSGIDASTIEHASLHSRSVARPDVYVLILGNLFGPFTNASAAQNMGFGQAEVGAGAGLSQRVESYLALDYFSGVTMHGASGASWATNQSILSLKLRLYPFNTSGFYILGSGSNVFVNPHDSTANRFGSSKFAAFGAGVGYAASFTFIELEWMRPFISMLQFGSEAVSDFSMLVFRLGLHFRV